MCQVFIVKFITCLAFYRIFICCRTFKNLLNKNIVFYSDSRNIYVHLLFRNMIFVFVLTSKITNIVLIYSTRHYISPPVSQNLVYAYEHIHCLKAFTVHYIKWICSLWKQYVCYWNKLNLLCLKLQLLHQQAEQCKSVLINWAYFNCCCRSVGVLR
jgi:hypothetical protein